MSQCCTCVIFTNKNTVGLNIWCACVCQYARPWCIINTEMHPVILQILWFSWWLMTLLSFFYYVGRNIPAHPFSSSHVSLAYHSFSLLCFLFLLVYCLYFFSYRSSVFRRLVNNFLFPLTFLSLCCILLSPSLSHSSAFPLHLSLSCPYLYLSYSNLSYFFM